MKIKPKEIVTLVVCFLVIGGAAYFMINTLKPKKAVVVPAAEQQFISEVESVSKGVDEKALEKVKKLTDYGKPKLENIGKSDPFSSIQ